MLVSEVQPRNASAFILVAVVIFASVTNSLFIYKFLVHKDSNEPVPINFLNESGNFFEEEDFKLADIVIDGNLDGKGNFNGELTIYDKKIKYDFNNHREKNNRAFYGNIPIKLGYSMGKEEESKLKDNLWNKINDKVSNYGGIYLYRDNFRVLPYGRANLDFLGIEERRTKRISTYFFSYRRLFGYIELSRIMADVKRRIHEESLTTSVILTNEVALITSNNAEALEALK